MDIFSSLIKEEVSFNIYTLLRANNYRMSHLLFVDDLLVVGEADHLTTNALHRALGTLASYFTLSINYNKHAICFPTRSNTRANLQKFL